MQCMMLDLFLDLRKFLPFHPDLSASEGHQVPAFQGHLSAVKAGGYRDIYCSVAAPSPQMADPLACSVCLCDENDSVAKVFSSPIEDETRDHGCGHICCTDCWKRLLAGSRDTVNCPVCRRDVTSWARAWNFDQPRQATRLASLRRRAAAGGPSCAGGSGSGQPRAQPAWAGAAHLPLTLLEWTAVPFFWQLWAVGWALRKLAAACEGNHGDLCPPSVHLVFRDKAMKVVGALLGILACTPLGLAPVGWMWRLMWASLPAMLRVWAIGALLSYLLRLLGLPGAAAAGPLQQLWSLSP